MLRGPESRTDTVIGVAARTLDITGLTCPMTWVKTKLELDRIGRGDELTVRCPPGEALENVPRSARDAGHEVAVDGRPCGSCAGEQLAAAPSCASSPAPSATRGRNSRARRAESRKVQP